MAINGVLVEFPFKDSSKTIPDFDAFYDMPIDSMKAAVLHLQQTGRLDVIEVIKAQRAERAAAQQRADQHMAKAEEARTRAAALEQQKSYLVTQLEDLDKQHLDSIKDVFTGESVTITKAPKPTKGGCCIL